MSATATVRLAMQQHDDGGYRCEIEMSGAKHIINACGDCDTLGDFARAGLMAGVGGLHATFAFDNEPEETRVVINRYFDFKERRLRLKLHALAFPDIAAQQPDDRGTLLFEAACDPDDFAREVLRNLRSILDGLSPPDHWNGNFPFPMRALDALAAALDTVDLQSPPPDRSSATIWTASKPPKPG